MELLWSFCIVFLHTPPISIRVGIRPIIYNNPPFIINPPYWVPKSFKGGYYKIILIRWRRRRKFWWFFIDFSIENMIFECENVKFFACGALECPRSSKNLIKSLILAKIGAEGAEKIWGYDEFNLTPPCLSRIFNKGGFKLNNRSDINGFSHLGWVVSISSFCKPMFESKNRAFTKCLLTIVYEFSQETPLFWYGPGSGCKHLWRVN